MCVCVLSTQLSPGYLPSRVSAYQARVLASVARAKAGLEKLGRQVAGRDVSAGLREELDPEGVPAVVTASPAGASEAVSVAAIRGHSYVINGARTWEAPSTVTATVQDRVGGATQAGQQGQPPRREGDVVGDAREVASRADGVALQELLVRRERREPGVPPPGVEMPGRVQAGAAGGDASGIGHAHHLRHHEPGCLR